MHHHHTEDLSSLITTFTLEKKPKSLVIVTGEIPLSELAKHEGHVLAELGKDIEMKGFRKGHVPESALRKQIGEMALFTETAEHTLSHMYASILEHFKLDAIGRPQITPTKLVPGNPFGFTIEISVIPEVTLPDCKKIAEKINKTKDTTTVTDADIDEAIKNIQRQKIAYDRLQEKARAKKAQEDAGLTLPTPETTSTDAEADADTSKLPVPELTDAYVKTLGAFETVDAFKTQIREHLTKEKMEGVMSKHRGALTEALINESTIDLPDVLIESEIGQMFSQMDNDLSRAGLTIEGYLEHMSKTREDMIKDWTPTAEKRAKTQLILNAIADTEKIEPNAEEVEAQAKQLMDSYKDADPVRVRIYIASMLQNEAVMKFLETQ